MGNKLWFNNEVAPGMCVSRYVTIESVSWVDGHSHESIVSSGQFSMKKEWCVRI